MKATCLINNYNYGNFLDEALQSCVNQTRKFDEIIIVDDGSTDDSVLVAQKYCAVYPDMRLIKKKNAGQLSCFEAGFLESSGDLLFFLDADDIYDEKYLETALQFYETNPTCDFLYCSLLEFGSSNQIIRRANGNIDHGCTLLLTYSLQEWIGAQTSAISMRRDLLTKILPLPLWSDWITRADDCLVIGASLAGGRKIYLDQCLIRYRIHGTNNFSGRSQTPEKKFIYKLAKHRLYNYFSEKYRLENSMLKYLYLEFKSSPQSDLSVLTKYIRAVQKAPISFLNKIRNILEMLHYFIWR